jgi:CRP-like cAMP-binding protein
MDDAAAILARTDFFSMCNDEQRRMLGFASDRRYVEADDVIYQAGDVPEGAHVLVSGTLKARNEGVEAGKPYALSEPGSIVSPMALILDKPRPVTITAVTDCELLFVPRSAFLKLIRQYPDLAQKAAQRIERELSGYLSALDPLKRKMKPR